MQSHGCLKVVRAKASFEFIVGVALSSYKGIVPLDGFQEKQNCSIVATTSCVYICISFTNMGIMGNLYRFQSANSTCNDH